MRDGRAILRSLALSAACAVIFALVCSAVLSGYMLLTLTRKFGLPLTFDLARPLLVRALAGWPNVLFFAALFWSLASWRFALGVSLGILLALYAAFVPFTHPANADDALKLCGAFALLASFNLFLRLSARVARPVPEPRI